MTVPIKPAKQFWAPIENDARDKPKNVDGRDKPGHDEEGARPQSAFPISFSTAAASLKAWLAAGKPQ
jgi:hypothetical protein